jgi:group I intron endonuclease
MDGVGTIYRHVYNVDGRSYIGQTIGIYERTKTHKRSKDDTHFHRAVRKYGWESFTTEILHENIDTMYLDEWEMYYISKYDTFGKNGFNMTAGGSGIRGYRHTEEHKQHLSERMKGTNNPFYGKKHSQKTLEMMSETRRGESSPNFGKNSRPSTRKR